MTENDKNEIRTDVESGGAQPVKKRYVVLDALRGFAILGICLANFQEFSLYSFQSEAVHAAMPSYAVDGVVGFLLRIFVDGKFYTIFSILFGIGFSIIIANAKRRGANGMRIFYRRMTVLLIIGLLHLWFLWSGDILALYALMGMLLPLAYGLSDKKLLWLSGALLLLPLVVDTLRLLSGVDPSDQLYAWWWQAAYGQGIDEDHFARWLVDTSSYADMHRFLVQGAVERMWEFVTGNRYYKVLGLFVLGLWIGKRRLYADLKAHECLLRRVFAVGVVMGLPLSVVYAVGSDVKPLQTLVYTLSVYPMGLAYMSGLALLYMRSEEAGVWRFFAYPGRLALSNYLLQSVLGVVLFYGIGLAWGAEMGLGCVCLVALGVYVAEVLMSALWLRRFRYGLIEWLWRMLTYGRFLDIRK